MSAPGVLVTPPGLDVNDHRGFWIPFGPPNVPVGENHVTVVTPAPCDGPADVGRKLQIAAQGLALLVVFGLRKLDTHHTTFQWLGHFGQLELGCFGDHRKPVVPSIQDRVNQVRGTKKMCSYSMNTK